MAEDKEKKPDKMTPEERLFRVIATGGRSPGEPPADQDPDLMETDPFFRLQEQWEKIKRSLREGLRRKLVDPFKRPGPKFHLPYGWVSALEKAFRLKTINQGLMVLVGFLTFYLFFDFVMGNGHRSPMAEPSGFSLPLGEKPGLAPSPELSHYLKPAKSRNVFLPPAPKRAQTGAGSAGGGLEAPPVKITLVGISWDKEGFVAMVEYEGEKGARFVRKGAVLQNGVKVEEIKEFSVTLSQGEDTWELT